MFFLISFWKRLKISTEFGGDSGKSWAPTARMSQVEGKAARDKSRGGEREQEKYQSG